MSDEFLDLQGIRNLIEETAEREGWQHVHYSHTATTIVTKMPRGEKKPVRRDLDRNDMGFAEAKELILRTIRERRVSTPIDQCVLVKLYVWSVMRGIPRVSFGLAVTTWSGDWVHAERG